MTTVDVSLGGQVYSMPASFAAMEQIAEKVGDPFRLALAMKSGHMLTAIQTIDAIAIGVRLAGCKLERAEIGQEIVSKGAQEFLKTASNYVIAVVSGGPAVPLQPSKKKQKRKAIIGR
jgi:hypothetical protein